MWSGGTTVLMEELKFSDGEGVKAGPGFGALVGTSCRLWESSAKKESPWRCSASSCTPTPNCKTHFCRRFYVYNINFLVTGLHAQPAGGKTPRLRINFAIACSKWQYIKTEKEFFCKASPLGSTSSIDLRVRLGAPARSSAYCLPPPHPSDGRP